MGDKFKFEKVKSLQMVDPMVSDRRKNKERREKKIMEK